MICRIPSGNSHLAVYDSLSSLVTYQIDMPGLDMGMNSMGNAFGLNPILAYEAHVMIA